MRILRVNIRNLNSLRGEHRIDFTVSPLADHSLYAIVGPTGAGKTTILDAITLALYGQTERNKSELDRKDGSASVLTYGEGECLAELDYETTDGRYRSAWSRKRARKKPDGNLMASKHSISRFNPETGAWDMLATKKREVAEMTLEVVGLDYERFVRSVMLTQGDFARFLKSDVGNKAEILEKITGTEIYRNLSVAAFRKAKIVREAHDRATEALATMLPLDEEARARLDEQLLHRKIELKGLRGQLSNLTGQLNAYGQLKVLQTKSATAKTEHDRLQTAWDNLEADRARLAANDDLQTLRADLAADLRIGAELAGLDDALTAADRDSVNLRAAVSAAADTFVSAKGKLEDFNEKLPAREKKFAAVAELEKEVTVLIRDLDREEKRRDKLREILTERRAKLDELTKLIDGIRDDLSGLKPEDVRRNLEESDAAIPILTGELETLDRQAERRKTADRLNTETKAAEKARHELTASEKALMTAEKVFTAREIELADRRASLNNQRVIASLTEHRHNLRPGEECPVCGAREHPALNDFEPVTDSALERMQTEINKLLDTVEAARRALKQARQKESVERRRFDGQQALMTELTSQLGETPVDPRSVEQLRAERSAVATRLEKASAEQVRLRQLQTNLPRLTALETESATVTVRVGELEKELETVTEALAVAEKSVAEKRARIKKEVGNHTAEACRELTRKKKESLTRDLAAAEKAEVDRQGQLAALTSRQTVIKEQQAKLTGESAKVRGRLAKELGQRSLTNAEARTRLLPENEALNLRTRLNKLATERATSATVSHNLATEVDAAAKSVAELPPADQLEKDHAQAEFKVSEADRLIGAIDLQITQDDQRQKNTAERKNEILNLRKDYDRWTTMNQLIGSADGKKFRSYAQAITLQRLIDVGNNHLLNINPRYRMQYAPPAGGGSETLEIVVIDRYHDDNRRTMATLSGGETFLISLSLALGLSELASGKRLIRSLFIDEGFGTLDSKTLDQAMTTLEQLRDEGKTIGLISHVPSLRERIQCQIRLEPVGDGFSKIKVLDS